MLIEDIFREIKRYNCGLVEVTGGEPLIQPECFELLSQLCDEGYKVMIETGGSLSIEDIDNRVTVIMDLKCPSSKMSHKNDYKNLNFLKLTDELKFVIGNREDFEWSKEIIKKHDLVSKCNIIFAPVFGKLDNLILAEWILNDNLEVRFQTQLHKYIWEPDRRGV